MNRIENTAPLNSSQRLSAPSVSIIVSALNEALTIEPALKSLLAIDYPQFEIIVINDRSTDSTGQLLDQMAAVDSQLRVQHIQTLPTGWLGKNHAMHLGAQRAVGEYLLFTDADISFSKDALSRAIHYCQTNQIDHLSLIFRVLAKSDVLRMTLTSFSSALMARFAPWKVATSKSHYFGIGAFNLMRRKAYFKSGGHSAIPMEVLDDIALGKIIKESGFKQDVLLGLESIRVEWYPNLKALVKGLEKNIFCGFQYRLSFVVAATVITLIVRVWPWIGLFVLSSITSGICLVTILVVLALNAFLLKKMGWGYRPLIYLPIVGLIDMFIWWRSTVLTLTNGGISWRGTFYRLAELRKAQAK